MDQKKPEIPKDLGVKVGTPLEVLWTEVKRQIEIVMKEAENTLIIQRENLKIADKKILEEKEKFK